MIIKFGLPALILSSVMFFGNSEDCSKDTKSYSKGKKPVKIGIFSGQTPDNPGFLKLEIKESNEVTFLNVVTLHLPPAEIEKLETKLVETTEKICFEKKPQTVEPCLYSVSENEITLKTIPGGKEVKLKRVDK
jgi:hypothetical protein